MSYFTADFHRKTRVFKEHFIKGTIHVEAIFLRDLIVLECLIFVAECLVYDAQHCFIDKKCFEKY